MYLQDILNDIRAGKNLDVHIKSDNKFVRKWIAQEGHMLDQLISDPAEEVRAAVASKGYGLDRLINDSSDWVKFAAMQALDKIRSHNAGYDIIHRIDIGDDHFVVGHNPIAPAPYVTWEFIETKNYYYQGHYFSEEKDALLDLFRRAGEELSFGDKSLALQLLTEDDRTRLREEREYDAVCYALDDLLANSDESYDRDALLKDPEFMRRAIWALDNINHSAENEAIADELDLILQDFPQHIQTRSLVGVFSEPMVIKFCPEEAELLSDLLKYPTAKIPDIYGPLGDNIDISTDPDKDYHIHVELMPSYDPLDPLKLSETEPHTISIIIEDKKHAKLFEQTFSALEAGGAFPGKYVLEQDGQNILTVTLDADENHRRVGREFVYKAWSQDDDNYKAHDGQTCTIKRALTPKENDVMINGLMWEAEFPDGDVLHVFDHELEFPKDRKLSLSEQVKNADAKQALQAQPSTNRTEPTR